MSQIKTASEVFEPIAKSLNPDYNGDSLFSSVVRGKYLVQLHMQRHQDGDFQLPTTGIDAGMGFPNEIADLATAITLHGFRAVQGAELRPGEDPNYLHYILFKDGYSILLTITNYGDLVIPDLKPYDKMLQDYIGGFLPPDEYFVIAQLSSSDENFYIFLVDVHHQEKGHVDMMVTLSKISDIPHLTIDHTPLSLDDKRAKEFDLTMIQDGYSVWHHISSTDGRVVTKQYDDWVFSSFEAKPAFA